jgi:hypothetical protein
MIIIAAFWIFVFVLIIAKAAILNPDNKDKDMSIDSSTVQDIKISPPYGELLYLDPYTGEMTNIDTRVDVQGELSYSGVVCDSSYPPTYDVREKADIDEYGTVQITHGYSKVDWDGAFDSLPLLVYDGSYPPTYNIKDGILYVSQGPEDVLTIDIANPTDTSTEPSDLKNIKTNIRKVKPDINSKLKRV